MQVFAIVVSLAVAAVGIALFVKAIREIIATVRIGQPTVGRTADRGARWTNMLKETLGHTRMLQWSVVGIGHWFVFIGFGLLFFTLLTAFGQLFDAHFALPLIGHFFVFEWVSELFTVLMLIAIVAFIGYRASRPKERERGPRGRFFGSTMWQGYFARLREHRRPRRGRRARRRQGRGLHLEGPARLHHLHRVRPLPVAVPGLEHREAALAQAARHGLRDHAYAKAPYLLAAEEDRDRPGRRPVKAEAERPLVGATCPRAARRRQPRLAGTAAVIDPDVLWSCTTCGACVEQCPVDIEHVDHIVDMRRYQVLVESAFPDELNGCSRAWRTRATPGTCRPRARLDWAKGLPFEVKQVGEDVEDLDEVDYLFWVGCAGAYEDRAKKTTRAVAELLRHSPASRSRCSATARPAPATRPGGPATSSSSSSWRCRTSRPQGGEGEEGRRHLRALLQHAEERVPAARRRARGRAPHPAAQPAGPRGQG
jgi:ferredoxin